MKKKNTRPRTTATTAFAPRQSVPRPFVATLCFAFAVLTVVSFLFYAPGQPYFFQEGFLQYLSQSTQEAGENPVGKLGATLALLTRYAVGVSGWLLPVFAFWLGYLCLFRKAHLVRWWKFLSMAVAIACAAGLMAWLQQIRNPSVESASAFRSNEFVLGWGGWLGAAFYYSLLKDNLGSFGTFLVLFVLYALSMTVVFVENPARAFDVWHQLFQHWKEYVRRWWVQKREMRAALREARKEEKRALREAAEKRREEARKERAVKKLAATDSDAAPAQPVQKPVERKVQEAEPPPAPVAPERAAPAEPSPALSQPVPRDEPAPKTDTPVGTITVVAAEKVEKATSNKPKMRGNYVFPPLDLLSEAQESAEADSEMLQETFDALVRTLDDFKIKVHPAEIHTGPVITRYEVTPAAGVRVEKIANLEKNIALSLRALAVRILAPVPGKGTVGVEVPNRDPQTVCLREIIESKAWADSRAEIPVVLGKDVTGKPIVTDLTKMPHCLIAGSTGSGKTVCINAIIASLLYHASPADLRFIMVDPKIVEMQIYNDLPHMLIPVVTDPKRVPGALKWLITEMERRYHIFAKVGVRNIAGFNAKILKNKEEEEKARALDAEMTAEERIAAAALDTEDEEDDGLEIPDHKLPYIVCIIDELADLMMVAPADIETGVARLAQLARAAGIHLILATQRPSVNVITGVIKANLPTRIAFKVASKIDSRTILDQNGADALIGKGDMLFIPPGTSSLVRAQGAFVSDDEINGIVEYIKERNGPPDYSEDIQREIESEDETDGPGGADGEGEWDDERVPDAIAVLRATKRASTSMLQRRLKIGYNRAARIMDILEDEGIVGPENGSSPREILKDLDNL